MAYFIPLGLTFQPIGLDALPYILIRNIFVLCLIAFFFFSGGIQDLVLFSNSLFHFFFIFSAFSSNGPTLPVLLTLAFALFEGSLLFILAIMTRNLDRPLVHYLPAFIVLISISSILEVIVL
ncbi:hypothetical protein ES708_33282 [subsurface metagenome]